MNHFLDDDVDALLSGRISIEQAKYNSENQEMVKYADAGFAVQTEKGPIINTKPLLKYFKDRYKPAFNDATAFYFDKTHYRHAENLFILSELNRLTKKQFSANKLESVAKDLRMDSYLPQSAQHVPAGFINLKNGILHIDSGELIPHSADYFFKYVLEHAYTPGAQCHKFLNFLHFVFQDDQGLIDLTQQAFGYTLMGGDPIAHRAFMLHGDGRNGKSTWLRVLQELLGKDNWSAVSMNLLDKPFSMVQLDGKIANIVEESPYKINPEAFKNVVGGGYVTAAQKGKPEYDLKVNARLFFACNELPLFDEKSIAVKERLIIIPFNRYIEPHERTDDVLNDIIREEMPGVLNFALEGIKKFKANNFKLIVPKSVEEKAEEFNTESDSVYEWCLNNLEADKNGINSTCKMLVIYRCYTQDMDVENRPAVHFKTFKKRLVNYLKAKKIMYKMDRMSDREGLFLRGVRCVNPSFNHVALNLSFRDV